MALRSDHPRPVPLKLPPGMTYLRVGVETGPGVSDRPAFVPRSHRPRTDMSFAVPCECGAVTQIGISVDGPQEVITLTGVPCKGCDRTHTVEIRNT